MLPRRSGRSTNPRFRRLLIPLLYDRAPDVAHEAMASVQRGRHRRLHLRADAVALLRNRQLKARAREVLVSYGEPVVDVLAHFLRDPEEDIWVRRHIPTTLAQIPSQKSVDVLVAALAEPDGFLRYKVVAALERLRRSDAPLDIPARADRDADASRRHALLQLPVAALQPVRRKALQDATLLSQSARAEDGADARTASTGCWR